MYNNNMYNMHNNIDNSCILHFSDDIFPLKGTP